MPKLYEDDYRASSTDNVRDEITAKLTGKPAPWQGSLGEIGKPFAAGTAVPLNQTAGASVPGYSVPQITAEGTYRNPTLGAALTMPLGKKRELTMGGELNPIGRIQPMGQLKYMRRF